MVVDNDKQFESQIKEAKSLEELSLLLQKILKGYEVWDDGTLGFIKRRIDEFHGLKIEIYSDEHSPPHFHVKSAGMNASFRIENCELIRGTIGSRERKNIEWWHKHSKSKLISIWNETRPTNCPVGKIK
jgi:Domain of unknown function (DUF4160)